MSRSQEEFESRLARLPKRAESDMYKPLNDTELLQTIWLPLSYPFAGVVGLVLFFIAPQLFVGGDGDGHVAKQMIWAIPSVILTFAVTVPILVAFGLSSGGHVRAAGIGAVLGLILVRTFAG